MKNIAVSAFAARKAARRPIGEVTTQDEAQTLFPSKTYHDSLNEFEPPRKKQKRRNEPKDSSPRSPQQKDDLVRVRDGPLDGGMEDIEEFAGSDSSYSSESEIAVQSMAPVQRLSTFNLSRSKVLSESETEWTVRLHENDVSI